MLYLLKASRIREYHQQNVAILGAPEGDEVRIGYNLRWVQPGLLPVEGQGCVLVFSDNPWAQFVPVRFGVLSHVGQSGERLELTVRLSTFVRPGQTAVLSERWSAGVGPLNPGREQYLFEDENLGLAAPRSLAEEAEAWRSIVDELAGDGYFERSIFARLISVIDDRGLPVDSERAVVVGDRLTARFEVRPARAPEEPIRIVLDSDPVGAVEMVDGPDAILPGIVDVPIVARTPGSAQLTFRFLPEPALASRPELWFSIDGASETAPPVIAATADAGPSAFRPGDLGRLVARLEREAHLDHTGWIGLLDDVLLPSAPTDPGLLEALARHAFAAGDAGRAVEALRRVAPRSADGDRLLLLASIATGNARELADLVETVDLDDERLFADLLDTLDGAPEAVWQPILNRLPHELVGEDKTVRLLNASLPYVRGEALIVGVAEHYVFAGLYDDAAKVLVDRWPIAGSCPARVLGMLEELGRLGTRLVPYLEQHLTNMAELGDWSAVEKVLDRSASAIDDAEVRRLSAKVGDLMAVADEPHVRLRGAMLLTEAAQRARLTDLDEAVAYGERAVTICADNPDSPEAAAVAALRVSLALAIEQTSVFREYKEALSDARLERVRRRFGGQVLHIVTGHAQPPWADQLRNAILLAELRWHQTAKDRSPETAWTSGMRPDRDAVLMFTDWIGHDVSIPVKTACIGRSVPLALSDSFGLRGALAALDVAAG